MFFQEWLSGSVKQVFVISRTLSEENERDSEEKDWFSAQMEAFQLTVSFSPIYSRWLIFQLAPPVATKVAASVSSFLLARQVPTRTVVNLYRLCLSEYDLIVVLIMIF